MTDQDCVFCRISRGELDADVTYEDDRVVAFRDANPQAPTHLLVIPREHVPMVDDLEDEHAELVGRLFLTARDQADREDLDGYRLVMNNGPRAGQSVFHIHLHVLGGRSMGWPPG